MKTHQQSLHDEGGQLRVGGIVFTDQLSKSVQAMRAWCSAIPSNICVRHTFKILEYIATKSDTLE